MSSSKECILQAFAAKERAVEFRDEGRRRCVLNRANRHEHGRNTEFYHQRTYHRPRISEYLFTSVLPNHEQLHAGLRENSRKLSDAYSFVCLRLIRCR